MNFMLVEVEQTLLLLQGMNQLLTSKECKKAKGSRFEPWMLSLCCFLGLRTDSSCNPFRPLSGVWYCEMKVSLPKNIIQ